MPDNLIITESNKPADVNKMNLKTIILSSFVLSLAMSSVKARDVWTEYPNVVGSNHVTITLKPDGEVPEWMAVIVQTNDPMDAWRKNERDAMEKWRSEVKTNRNARPAMTQPPSNNYFDDAKWIPFRTNLLVDLGPGDGKREILLSYRYKGQTRSDGWGGSGIMVQTVLPFIVITNPTQKITSQPVVQFQGYCSKALSTIHYDLLNQNGDKTISGGDGFVNDQYYDRALFEFTTNYFTCYDVQLSPGTNMFVLHCTDQAGNALTTNLVVVFTTVGDTNPPSLALTWPTNGMKISDSQFDLRGISDDYSADVTAFVTDFEGQTTVLNGFVERQGTLWVERIPLKYGYTYITLVACDAAHNSSITNITVVTGQDRLVIDPVKIPQQWGARATITGTYSRTHYSVSVNGVKATMDATGRWVATNVPVYFANSGGGTALFNATATPNEGVQEADEPIATDSLPVKWGAVSNFLQAGVSFQLLNTNEYNHYQCYLSLTNTFGTNIYQTWMLPKGAYRYSLRLIDKDGKEIAKTEHFKKLWQALPSDLNIHHLGKNELTNIDGIIPLATSAFVRLASMKLDEHFQLPPPGEYHLEIVARLFKIADDGQLVPFEFLPISVALQIIDQPSEMVFYLNDLQKQGKLVWGAELASLRVGVAHGFNGRQLSEANQIEIFLQNTSTNDFQNWNLRLPNPNEQFDVSLYDASGKEVPKTTLGKQQGQPLSLNGQNPRKSPGVMDEINAIFGSGNVRRRNSFRPLFLSAKDATECGRFNLNDYFDINSPGKYRLAYQQRFYRWNTNSTLTGITLPMVTVPLDIQYIPGQ
jgi:hypothetical protein